MRRSNLKKDKISLRSCIDCKEPKPKSELLRMVRTPEGNVKVDETGKQSGRGTYVCLKERCVNEALKGSRLAKALKVKPDDIDKEELSKQIKKHF